MIQYEKLRNDILRAREMRWETVIMLSSIHSADCIITITANIAGEDKDSPAVKKLIDWAEAKMFNAGAVTVGAYGDAAGYMVFMRSAERGEKLKRIASVIEMEEDFCRLLDIDVYGRDGKVYDRESAGLPPRSCLLCRERAADCIRLKRHEYKDIKSETERLLAGFFSSIESTD